MHNVCAVRLEANKETILLHNIICQNKGSIETQAFNENK